MQGKVGLRYLASKIESMKCLVNTKPGCAVAFSSERSLAFDLSSAVDLSSAADLSSAVDLSPVAAFAVSTVVSVDVFATACKQY